MGRGDRQFEELRGAGWHFDVDRWYKPWREPWTGDWYHQETAVGLQRKLADGRRVRVKCPCGRRLIVSAERAPEFRKCYACDVQSARARQIRKQTGARR